MQGAAQNDTINDDMMALLMDRTHLAKSTLCPYAASGPGYELIEEMGHGLLTSVQ